MSVSSVRPLPPRLALASHHPDPEPPPAARAQQAASCGPAGPASIVESVAWARLSAAARAVLVVYAARCGPDGVAAVGGEELARLAGYSRSAAYAARAELVAEGVLQRRSTGGGRSASVFVVAECARCAQPAPRACEPPRTSGVRQPSSGLDGTRPAQRTAPVQPGGISPPTPPPLTRKLKAAAEDPSLRARSEADAAAAAALVRGGIPQAESDDLVAQFGAAACRDAARNLAHATAPMAAGGRGTRVLHPGPWVAALLRRGVGLFAGLVDADAADAERERRRARGARQLAARERAHAAVALGDRSRADLEALSAVGCYGGIDVERLGLATLAEVEQMDAPALLAVLVQRARQLAGQGGTHGGEAQRAG